MNLPENFILLIYGSPGSGKSTLIKRILDTEDFGLIVVITTTDDYESNGNMLVFQDIDEEAINYLSNSHTEHANLRKLIIFDDFLAIDLSTKSRISMIKNMFSTSRHSNLSIIVSTQLFKPASLKICRMCASYLATFKIDEDIKPYLKSILPTDLRKKMENIVLEKYQFLFVPIRDPNSSRLLRITSS